MYIKKQKEKKGKKARGNVRSLCYQTHACCAIMVFVLGMSCNIVMMAEGAGSNICSRLYPKFRDWKV